MDSVVNARVRVLRYCLNAEGKIERTSRDHCLHCPPVRLPIVCPHHVDSRRRPNPTAGRPGEFDPRAVHGRVRTRPADAPGPAARRCRLRSGLRGRNHRRGRRAKCRRVVAQEYLSNPPGDPARVLVSQRRSRETRITTAPPTTQRCTPLRLARRAEKRATVRTRRTRLTISERPRTKRDCRSSDEGSSPSMPIVMTCIHDGVDPLCGTVAFGATPPAQCTEMHSAPTPAQANAAAGRTADMSKYGCATASRRWSTFATSTSRSGGACRSATSGSSGRTSSRSATTHHHRRRPRRRRHRRPLRSRAMRPSRRSPASRAAETAR